MSVSSLPQPPRRLAKNAKKKKRSLSAEEKADKHARYEARVAARIDRLAGTSPGGRVFTYATLHLKGIMWSREHVRRQVLKGLFPPPRYLGERSPVWSEAVLDQWLAERAAAAEVLDT